MTTRHYNALLENNWTFHNETPKVSFRNVLALFVQVTVMNESVCVQMNNLKEELTKTHCKLQLLHV